jgi:hypothetical protein
MIRNPKTCFFIFIIIVFILTGNAESIENKIEKPKKTSNKVTLEKRQKNNCLPLIDERYYMMILGLICHSEIIDPGIIAKNTIDPSGHAELRIIDPYTKKEITGFKMPPNYLIKNKLWKDELFSMRGVRPDPEIDKGIVKKNYTLNMQYEMNTVNPYSKNKRFGY